MWIEEQIPRPADLESTKIITGPTDPPIIRDFAQGVAGMPPSPKALVAARMIVEEAARKAPAMEIEVDDADGSLSFQIRTESGLLVTGELSFDGNLQANVYDDENPDSEASVDEIWVRHLPQTSAEDLMAFL